MEESISWLFDYVYYLCEGAIPIKTRNNPQRESLVFKMGPLIINDNNVPHPQNKNKKQSFHAHVKGTLYIILHSSNHLQFLWKRNI